MDAVRSRLAAIVLFAAAAACGIVAARAVGVGAVFAAPAAQLAQGTPAISPHEAERSPVYEVVEVDPVARRLTLRRTGGAGEEEIAVDALSVAGRINTPGGAAMTFADLAPGQRFHVHFGPDDRIDWMVMADGARTQP